jgi:hypothetical protein
MLRTAEATPAPSGIPLELMPLLQPYRRHEHLSLRLERLPNRARLSRGRINDDRSWSLTLDDLHDLVYLPPEGLDKPHTLALRVISLDGDIGATLAVLDVPVAPGDARAVAAPRPASTPSPAATADAEVELRLLRDALAAAKASLAAREAELAAARAAWDGELQQRLAAAAAEAAATLEQSRAAWQAAEKDRAAQAAAQATALIEQRLAAAQDAWQQEARAVLAQAEEGWKAKAQEAARLAAAAAQKHEQTAAALAEATARLGRAEAELAAARAASETDRAALRRLKDELAAAQAALAAREAALAATQRQAEESGAERARQAVEAELAAARSAWEGELQQRLAEAAAEAEAQLAAYRAEWEGELQQHLAAAAAEAAAALEQSRAEWQAALEARAAAEDDRAALSEEEVQRRIDAARQAWEQEASAALAAAAEAWKAGEAERLAAATAQGREEWAQALAEAARRLERAEAELARMRAAAETGRGELRPLGDDRAAAQPDAVPLDPAPAPSAAKRGLLGRLAKIRLRWPVFPAGRVRRAAPGDGVSDGPLPMSAGRLAAETKEESTVSEPAEPRFDLPAEIPVAPRGRLDIAKLPQVQSLLAQRLQQEARAEPAAPLPAPPRSRQARPRRGRRLVLGGALLAGLAAAAMLYRGGGTAAPAAGPRLAALAGWIDSSVRKLDALILPTPQEAPAIAAPRTVIGGPGTRLHASPSPKAAVLANLPRDTEVTPLERRGKWVRIRVDAAGARPQEGWVAATALKETDGS